MTLSEDISVNLANVHLALNKFVDADHQYQATMKSSVQTSRGSSIRSSALCEYSAYAQFLGKRNLESVHSLLRAIHLEPANLRRWYNLAVVRSAIAQQTMQKKGSTSSRSGGAVAGQRTAAEIENSSEELRLAHATFEFLSGVTVPRDAYAGPLVDRDLAGRHARMCEVCPPCIVFIRLYLLLV